MGLAVAVLAPAAVSTALGLWGDADQQADVPAAVRGRRRRLPRRSRCSSRAPLFDPLHLETRARRADGGFVLDGVKSLVPRAADAELFVVAAELEGAGPALFLVESRPTASSSSPSPRWACAPPPPAADARGRQLPAEALLGDADPRSTPSACSARGSPGARVAVGTAQAVLDYVVPYVNERVAFGEPISHRQAVAFAVVGHRHRARGHAARDLPRRQPRRPGQRLRPRDHARAPALLREGDVDRLRGRRSCSAATAS